MHLRRFLILLAVLLALPLAGCITSQTDLFADEPGATPLPEAFILISKDAEKPEGGRVFRDGDYYVAVEDDDAAVYRLHALDGTDGTYFVGIDRDFDGVGANYALVRITGRELVMIGVVSGWLEADQKLDDALRLAFDFDDRDELLAMFRRAASQVETRADWIEDDSSFRIFDLADGAQKEEGERLLAEARKLREQREQEQE